MLENLKFPVNGLDCNVGFAHHCMPFVIYPWIFSPL